MWCWHLLLCLLFLFENLNATFIKSKVWSFWGKRNVNIFVYIYKRTSCTHVKMVITAIQITIKNYFPQMLRTWKEHYNRSVWPAAQKICPVIGKFALGCNRWLALISNRARPSTVWITFLWPVGFNCGIILMQVSLFSEDCFAKIALHQLG